MGWGSLTQKSYTPMLVSVIGLTNHTGIVWPVSESEGNGWTGLYDCWRGTSEAWSGPIRERHREREKQRDTQGRGLNEDLMIRCIMQNVSEPWVGSAS